MIGIYSEKIKSDFEGTIIDLETIGYFDDRYVDSRRYRHIIPIIFGFITKEGIRILYAKREDVIPKLKEEIMTMDFYVYKVG
jgi:F0F1-type ATP synthase assembly protein I